ncbi:twin-arginine translocation signal domain-containing protein [Dermatophilaceae bacterium Soc4.6]
MQRIMERRHVLRAASAAGAAAVTGLALTDSARADDGEGGDSVLGAWVVTHRDDPPGPPNIGKSIVTAALGGALENVEIAPPTGVGAGAWRSLGGGRFQSVFQTGAPGQTATDPGVIVEVRPRGRVHGNTMSGTYTVRALDADNGAVLFSGTGTFTGIRLIP